MTRSVEKSWMKKLAASDFCKHFFDTSILKANFDQLSKEGRVKKTEFDILTKSVGIYADEIRNMSFFLEECNHRASLDFMDCLLVIEKIIKGYLGKLNARSRIQSLTKEFEVIGIGTTIDQAVNIIMDHGNQLSRSKVTEYVRKSARFYWSADHFLSHEEEMK
jgi:hypothetical protein